MLEILFLVYFCKNLASIAKQKNRPGSWGALGAVFWIGGEVGGAMVGASSSNDGFAVYGFAIVGAGIGAVLAYVIVRSLPEIPIDTGLPRARVV